MENHFVHPRGAQTVNFPQAGTRRPSDVQSISGKEAFPADDPFLKDKTKRNDDEKSLSRGELTKNLQRTGASAEGKANFGVSMKTPRQASTENGANEFNAETARGKTFRLLTLKDILPQWGFSPEEVEASLRTERRVGFPMALTPYFARYAGNPECEAIRKQVLPSSDELMEREHFTTNPLKEQAPAAKNFNPVFLLQKYRGRALLMTAMECFGNCRFCFRRHLRASFPSTLLERRHFEYALNSLVKDVSIREIILSGGDPLTLEDELFFWLLMEFRKIEHLERIRVHTRAPVFFPEKISENFSQFLKLFSEQSAKPIYFVLHINHPLELSPETVLAIRRLHESGVTLLQQGALLRGVNDRTEVLAELYEKLTRIHVIPYYLHQLDRVKGAAHFEVDVETGRRIMRELRAVLPGFAVPRYVREIPGETGKTPLD